MNGKPTPYKLKTLTAEQAKVLLRKHGYNVPSMARALRVSPQALNRWLRLNGCQRVIQIECEESA